MKIASRILSLILCLAIFITANVVGVEAASIKVERTEKLVAEATAGTVELRWRKVSKATGYKVYQVVDGKLKAIKTVKNNKYIVEDLTASETYKFAVKTYRKYQGKTYWSSKYRSVTVTTDKMAKTPTPKAVATKNTVTLTWSEVEGATGYRVYQYSPEKDKYEVINSVKGTETYKVTSLKEDNTYKFKIKPYAKTSKGVVWNKASSAVTVQTIDKTKAKFESPVIGTKGVTLNWSEVEGATAYKLFKVVGGKLETVASGIKKTSYKVEKLESGKEYTFVVRAYKKVDGKVIWYTKSEPLTIKTKGTSTGTETTTKPDTEPTTKPNTDPTNPSTHTHTVVIDPAVEATCTKTGLTEGKHCSVCNTVIVAQKTVAKKAHSYTSSVTTQPTCKAEGVKTYKCSCGDKYTEKIAKKAHTLVTDSAVEATCTKNGLTEGKHCSVCGTVTVAQQTVAKKAHSYTSSVTKQATCKAEGVKTYKCSCGESYTEAIAKKAHSIITDYAVEATCVREGLTEGKHCASCGTVTVPQNVVAMKNHSDENKDGKCDHCNKALSGTEPTDPPTTQPTEPPTLPPVEEDLTAYRIAKYKQILEKDTLYFKISSKYSDGTMVPIEFGMKNGNMFMETTAEGLTMRIYYEKSKDKMTAYADFVVAWVYYNVPKDEMEDMDMTEMLDIMRIGETGFINVSRTKFNGKSVICESYLDSKTGYTMKYYFNDETLVGIERTHPKKSGEVIYVQEVTNNVKNSIFEQPKPTLVPPKAVVSLDEWLSEN